MRKLMTGLALLAAIALFTAPADAKKRHGHKHSGVAGTVLNATCAGACAEPPPPEPLYTGPVTVTVARASDGVIVASQAVSDGHFRLRVKKGSYEVSSVPPNPPTCEPTPQTVCPLNQAQGAAIVRPCLEGETKQVQVRRNGFARIELHVSNVCVV